MKNHVERKRTVGMIDGHGDGNIFIAMCRTRDTVVDSLDYSCIVASESSEIKCRRHEIGYVTPRRVVILF